MENNKAIDLLNQINDLKSQRDSLQLTIDSLTGELKRICPHPHGTRSFEKKYVPGGYLNQDEYVTTIYCKICGTKLNEHHELHGFS